MLLIGTVMKSTTRISKVKSPKRRSAPNAVNGIVPPRRIENAKRRPREYLTVKEVEKLLDAARERGRYGHRDATMILVGYRHGLRVSELCALRWDQVDFERGMLHVRRVKNGTPSVHPLGGSEIRALRRLRREQPESRHVFLTERLSRMSTAGFRKLIARTGEGSKFPFPVHPHMLRHACGY
jgi:integrase